ncbi:MULTISPECIES: SRPBCC family protein [unclassified Sphingomonas]|uniref:SRPBCC family protein n=1 Tax=unclassified Sphingomonas TaxID=196159 RepID=UPI0006F98C3D|nr:MULTISPECIES: SRPBCC family protein [unclassified Sphingomonas]KQM62668.1 cyclase [Sphingomonas sp. Leaf16]KQN14919.1 cyclase [Sphingomonas sp. Leaf29]KQN20451.1 cyclase [Sphingomonas sp. Leaf32]
MPDGRDPQDDAPASARKEGDVDALMDIKQAKGKDIVARAVTINRPANELFAYFRDFSNLPAFMENVERIDVLDAERSHWVVKAPAGRTVEWDATITEEVDGRFVAWTSEPGADIANSGCVTFKDAGARGTVVTATILYDPSGGLIGKIVAKMFQREPAIQARRDLRRFKQLMETGEVATAAMNLKQYKEEQA